MSIQANDTFTPVTGTWNISTSYTTGQIVTYNGLLYYCVVASTNVNPVGTTYWSPIAPGPSGAPDGDLTTHVGEVGATWAKAHGATGGISISPSGRIRTSDNTGGQYVCSATPASAQYAVQVDFVMLSTGDQQYIGGVVGRQASGANTFYLARYDWPISSSTAIWEMYKCVAGSYTLLGSLTGQTYPSGRMQLILQNGAQTLQYSSNGGVSWTTMLSATDSDAALTGTGLAGVQLYSSSTATTDSNGMHLDNFTVVDYGSVSIAPNNSGLNYSPSNWNVQSTYAATMNTGAYQRTLFSGTTCAINFNITNNTVGYIPVIDARIDGTENWNTYVIGPTTSVTPVPLFSATHLLEWRIRYLDRTVNSWNYGAANSGCTFIGLTLDSGATVSAPTTYPNNVLIFADSTVDAYQNQDWRSILGVEVGIIAWDGLGVTANNSSADDVPYVPSSYLYVYQGVSRNWTGVNLVVLNHGQNDGGSAGSSFQTAVQNFVTDIRTNRVVNVPILLTAPYTSSEADGSGVGNAGTANEAAALLAVATATGGNVTYWDKGTLINPANTSDTGDGVHPSMMAFNGKIFPVYAAKIQKALIPAMSTVFSF